MCVISCAIAESAICVISNVFMANVMARRQSGAAMRRGCAGKHNRYRGANPVDHPNFSSSELFKSPLSTFALRQLAYPSSVLTCDHQEAVLV